MACDLKRGQRGLQAELSTLACKLITQLASRCRAEARARRSLLTLSKISPCMFRHNPAQLTVVPLIETPGVDNGPRRRLADCMCFLNVLQRSDDRNQRTELSRATPSSARGRDLLQQGFIRESSTLSFEQPSSQSCPCQKRATEESKAERQSDVVRLHQRQPPREADVRSNALGSPTTHGGSCSRTNYSFWVRRQVTVG